MSVAGLPLLAQLPPPEPAGATRLLLLGGDDVVAGALRRAGYRVDRHALDTGPLAQPAGVPFTPPVVEWPFPDQSYDAVVLLDELALTVQEEEALAEAARVLRPGGVLLLRVPAAGLLAWLDGYNAYRYLKEVTHRGRLLPEMAGVGWRRHYRREDLYGLLRPHFRLRAMRIVRCRPLRRRAAGALGLLALGAPLRAGRWRDPSRAADAGAVGGRPGACRPRLLVGRRRRAAAMSAAPRYAAGCASLATSRATCSASAITSSRERARPAAQAAAKSLSDNGARASATPFS